MSTYPRASTNPDHADVAMAVMVERDRDASVADLRQRVVMLERIASERKENEAEQARATWKRIGLLQWAIGLMIAVVLGVGGGLLDKAYDAYGLLASRVIEVDQEGQRRASEVTEKLTTAINSLTNQVVRLDERLSAMQARLSELDGRRALPAGSLRAGSR